MEIVHFIVVVCICDDCTKLLGDVGLAQARPNKLILVYFALTFLSDILAIATAP